MVADEKYMLGLKACVCMCMRVYSFVKGGIEET